MAVNRTPAELAVMFAADVLVLFKPGYERHSGYLWQLDKRTEEAAARDIRDGHRDGK